MQYAGLSKMTTVNNSANHPAGLKPLSRPDSLFPLIRQISFRVSPVLARCGLSANQVTWIGLAAGIVSALAFAGGTHSWGMIGALLWMLCTLMDYCDGEVARITGKSSHYGALLDDIVDWIVHAAFFTGLGTGAAISTGSSMWLWLGLIAAAGSTLNTWMCWLRMWLRVRYGQESPRSPGKTSIPSGWKENYLYVFRGLFRADFWLLVLLLELFHLTWLLLPVFAVGTHVFWITGFIKDADKFVP
jgi:phosphatidylglycerophosphate synthase